METYNAISDELGHDDLVNNGTTNPQQKTVISRAGSIKRPLGAIGATSTDETLLSKQACHEPVS